MRETADRPRPTPPAPTRPALWRLAGAALLGDRWLVLSALACGGLAYFGLVPIWAAAIAGGSGGWWRARLEGLTAALVVIAFGSISWWFVAGLSAWVWWDGRARTHETRWSSLVGWACAIGFGSWVVWRLGAWEGCAVEASVCARRWFDGVWWAGAGLSVSLLLDVLAHGDRVRGADWHLTGRWRDWAAGSIVGVGVWMGWVWLAAGWAEPGSPPAWRITAVVYGGIVGWWLARRVVRRGWERGRAMSGQYAD